MTTTNVAPAAHTGNDNALSIFYLFASFFSGVVVMLVEIAGVRLLSPVFGNSIYTWTALIGVVLFAISFGNAIGGWLSDRSSAIASLHLSLLISAVTTFLLPTVAMLMDKSMVSFGPIAGPLVFSSFLFVIPATAIGMISPIALRLMSRISQDKHVGMVGGLINGSSAIGSVAGTLLTGFVLMRYLSVTQIYYLVSFFLLAVCVLSITLHKTMPKLMTIALVAASLGFITIFAASVRFVPGMNVVHQQLSYYQLLRVVDEELDDGTVHRHMLHDNLVQGTLELGTNDVPQEFQRIWRLLELQRESFDSALFVGGGTYGIPQRISKRWEDIDITVLEVDETVVQAAQDWFFLDDYPNINPVVSDARLYMNKTPATYDLIYLDAYSGWRSIPAHLTTLEFFTQVKNSLAPGGIVMMNLIATLDEPHTDLFDGIYTTIDYLYDDVQVYRNNSSTDDSAVINILLMFGENINPHKQLTAIDKETEQFLSQYVAPSEYQDRQGVLLTDAYSPIEHLVSRTLYQ